jgi:hypothetical protein
MEAAKRFFKGRKNGGELGLGELWMSGAFAGTVNTVVANPVEHIRISMSPPTYLTFEAVLINRTPDSAYTSHLRRPIRLRRKIVRQRRSITSLQSPGTMYAT